MGRLMPVMALVVTALTGLTLPTATGAQPDPNVDTFPLTPPPGLIGPRRLHATAYVVQAANESADPNDPLLMALGGQSLRIRIPHRLWCLAADEGSLAVTLKDGSRRAYIYAGIGPARVADCSSIFTKMETKLRAALERSTFRLAPDDAPYGVGSIQGVRLVPFRSIAIDRTAGAPLALGQVIYIPKLRGFRSNSWAAGRLSMTAM